MYYAYVLKSLKNGRFYYGSTKDINKRLEEHSSGKVKSTKYMRPWKLIYFEEHRTLKEARKREAYFKKLKNRKYIEWIIGSKRMDLERSD